MAPKRATRKRKAKGDGGMTLRSGPLNQRQVVFEDGSSRILPSPTSRKRDRKPKRCVYVDDEASVDRSMDEASNSLLNTIEDTPQADTPQSHTTPTLTFLEAVEVPQPDHPDRDEIVAKHKRVFGENVSLGLMNDVMGKFYVVRHTEPPLVPLCRLIATDAVRVAVEEATWLIPLFDRAGYVPTMGSFIVSLKGRHGETKNITQEMMARWDPIWQKINAEFEENLTGEWTVLRGKLFFVWDGNHRLKTWMRRIENVHANDEKYHAQVKCQFIEFDKKKEGELILSLDTTNEISRATATPNLGHEIFMFQKFGVANKQSIMEKLTPEQRTWMEAESLCEVRHNHGVAPWYSTPCILIAQLVWKGKWEKFLVEEESKLRGGGLVGDELKKKMDEAIKREEEKLRDSGYKYLSIANPTHGEEFFSMIYNKDWNDKSMIGITRDKLYSICTAKISTERRKEILHMMTLTKVKDPNGQHFENYKKLRSYMRQEAYWHGLYDEASLQISKCEVEGPEMPKTFEAFFKVSRKQHVTQAYTAILGNMKSAADCATLPELLPSSKRLVYRWLLVGITQKTIQVMPIETEEWLDLDDVNTMFPPSLMERGITLWERLHCPWWIEYPLGVMPKGERGLHAQFLEQNPEKVQNETNTTPLSLVETPLTIPSTSKGKKGKKKVAKKEVTPKVRKLILQDEEESLPAFSIGNEGTSIGVSMGRSFVSETILSRSAAERMPRASNIGDRYITYVDALLVDIGDIDDMAWASMEGWFQHTRGGAFDNHEYHVRGEPSLHAARLLFADFPTGMLVHGITEDVENNIPIWNLFSTPLVKGVMEIADVHMADEGFLVTLCLAQHLGKLVKHAGRFELALLCSWTLVCDGGYLHPITREQVTDLTIGLFYRKSTKVPQYDRKAGELVSPNLFSATRSCITEAHPRAKTDFTQVGGIMVRGGAERHPLFFSWLLETFTDSDDHVIDIFAGCGGLGVVCAEEFRHCLMMEADFYVFSECMEKKVCGPSTEEDE